MIEQIVIAVSLAGAVIVQRGMQQIAQEARNAGTAADRLGNALAAIGAAQGVRKLIDTLSTFQQLQNQIRSVTDSTEEATGAQSALFDVAQRTQSSWEDNIKVYTRVKRALDEVGLTSAEAIQITESLTKAMQIGGATGQERTSVMIQLAQAMASGRLQGDELRSVLENSTVLGTFLAKQMNTFRGNLRNLGREGKITSRDLIEMFRKYGSEIDALFAKTTPTIERGLQSLRNAANQTLLAFDKTIGFSSGLANGLVTLSQHMDTIAKLVPIVAAAFTALWAAMGGGFAIFSAMIAVLLLNPFSIFALGVAAAVFALINFGDQVRLSSEKLGTLKDLATVMWDDARQAAMNFLDFLNRFVPIVHALLISIVPEQSRSLSSQFMKEARDIDGLINLFIRAKDTIVSIFETIGGLIALSIAKAVNGVIDVIEGMLKSIASSINAVFSFFGADKMFNADLIKITRANPDAAGGPGEDLKSIWSAPMTYTPAQDYLKGATDRANVRGNDRVNSAWLTTAGMNPDLSAQQLALGTPGGNLNFPNTPDKNTVKQLERRSVLMDKVIRQLDQEQNLLFMSTHEKEIQSELDKIQEQFIKNKTPLNQQELNMLRARLEELSRLKTIMGTVQEGIDSVMSNLTNAFVQFVQTGKFSFKDLVNSILSDLARIAMTNLITKPLGDALSGLAGRVLGSFFGGLGGGAVGAPMNILPGNAAGTDSWRGGLTWVGERGPEIVNLPRGAQVTPNHRIGTGQVIVKNYGQDVTTREHDDGRTEIIVRGLVRDELASRGSRNVMKQIYGVPPNRKKRGVGL